MTKMRNGWVGKDSCLPGAGEEEGGSKEEKDGTR